MLAPRDEASTDGKSGGQSGRRRLSLSGRQVSIADADDPSLPIDNERSIIAGATTRRLSRVGDVVAPPHERTRKTSFKEVADKVRTGTKLTTAIAIQTADAQIEESAFFDKNVFEASSRSYGGLSDRARAVLRKLPIDRTDEDVMLLLDIIDRLSCFKKYPRSTKTALARVMEYERYDYGRILIKEGHDANELYFIVRGGVSIFSSQAGQHSRGKKVQVPVGGLGEGASFGELELIHNMKRKCTFICNLDGSEFLRIDKSDFKDVLQGNYEQEMKEKLLILVKLGITKDWPFFELQNLCGNCKFLEFAANKVIFGNTHEPSNFIYYITRGNCRIVREIYIIEKKHPYGQSSYRLATADDFKKRHDTRRRRGLGGKGLVMLQRRLWTITTFSEGKIISAQLETVIPEKQTGLK